MWPAANPFNIMSTEEAKELLKAGKRRLGGGVTAIVHPIGLGTPLLTELTDSYSRYY